MHQTRPSDHAPVSFWIGFCTLLSAAGWILSALHALNATGYLIVFAVAIVFGIIWRRGLGFDGLVPIKPAKLRRRCSRFFPGAFLVIAGLAVLGGILHAPSNYDALAYRVPRRGAMALDSHGLSPPQHARCGVRMAGRADHALHTF